MSGGDGKGLSGAAVPERFLTLSEVEHLTSFRKTYLYSEIKAGRFPAGKRFPDCRRVFWLATEISKWMQDRVVAAQELQARGTERLQQRSAQSAAPGNVVSLQGPRHG